MKSLKTSTKMKNDIEKLIKNALDGYELSYQDGAWESFEKKMKVKSKSHSYTWWIFGVAAAIISITTIYLLNNDNPQNKIQAKNKIEKDQSITDTKQKDSSHNDENHSKVNTHKENINASNSNLVNDNIFVPTETANSDVKSERNSNQVATTNLNSSSIQIENSQSEVKNKNDYQNSSVIEFIPTFSDKCKNESISIDNKNSFELILKTPSGREIGIEPNSKSEINLKEPGIYQLGYSNSLSNGTFKESSKFKVHGNPSINLVIDDVVSYKNGLPTINAEVNSSEENVLWRINHKTSAKSGKSVEFNLFNKGSYTIAAVSKNEFGCEAIEAKTIKLNEEYNLLAMSAFNPNSSDYRNSSFLPYALNERNVSFKMIILDPDNLGIVFETTEASNPWTGIDRRDGKMIPAQKAYIWKVSLTNPEQGEKSEYKGTIVRVP
jgi:hypothetical protein